MKEKSSLLEVVDNWERVEEEFEEAKILLDLAREESDEQTLKEVEYKSKKLEDELGKWEVKRLLGGEHDKANAIVSINAGAGGTEAQDWTEMLLRMYLRWAEKEGCKGEIVDYQPGEEAGIKSTTFTITGDYAYGYLRGEIGIHRLVRISPFDANKRRHTSFASVFVYPEVEEDVEVDIKDADLRIDTYRASGAGGQHVNKTDSAVRITHLPTGIVVQCQNERSQHKNKATAMKILRARLYEKLIEEKDEEMRKLHQEKKEIAWGSQIRSYVMQPYRMVKDHRTGVEVGDVDRVLDGDLESFINAYLLKAV
jgi:peptide chain release factor 2